MESNVFLNITHLHYHFDKFEVNDDGWKKIFLKSSKISRIESFNPQTPSIAFIMVKKVFTLSVVHLNTSDELSLPGSEDEEDNSPKQKNPNRRYIGIIFTLLSSVTFSVGTLLVKLLAEKGYHPLNIGVWRFLGIFFVYTPVLGIHLFRRRRIKKENDWKTENTIEKAASNEDDALKITWKINILLCCRWLMGCSAIILQYMSLQYLDLADSLVIMFSTPVFITLISPFVLKEKCSLVGLALAFLTLIGVGVMIRPPIFTGDKTFDSSKLTGFIFAFAAMIVTGISFMLIQRLRQIHFSVMLTFFGLWGTVECLILSYIHLGKVDYPVGQMDWIQAVVLALLSVSSQTFLTLALKFEKAGPVSLIRTCDVIFGLGLQFLILGTQLDLISLTGQFIVMLGVVATIAREWINKLDANHPTRIKCSCILR